MYKKYCLAGICILTTLVMESAFAEGNGYAEISSSYQSCVNQYDQSSQQPFHGAIARLCALSAQFGSTSVLTSNGLQGLSAAQTQVLTSCLNKTIAKALNALDKPNLDVKTFTCGQ